MALDPLAPPAMAIDPLVPPAMAHKAPPGRTRSTMRSSARRAHAACQTARPPNPILVVAGTWTRRRRMRTAI